MPVSPGYTLAPAYGVEKYVEIAGTNGGAKVTHDNLIITVWQTEDKLPDEATPVVFGDILVPRYAVDSTPDEQRAAFMQGMNGRLGAQFQLYVSAFGDDWPAAYEAILAVLNPPQELKQQLANSVQYVGGVPPAAPGLPLPVENYDFLKSQMGQFVERFEIGGNGGPNAKVPALLSVPPSVQWGQYVPLDFDQNTGEGVDDAYLPLLKTNGANGVVPEFFDMTTEAGVLECIAAVNRGNFFIPAIMPVDNGGVPSYYEINWPHSITRG